MQSAGELIKERKKLFQDAIYFRPTNRVASMSNVWGWKIIDSDTGISIEEANDDWSKMELVVREFIERYGFDGYVDLGTVNANNVTKALGYGRYKINGNVVISQDDPVIENDGYDEFMKDPNMYTWIHHGPKHFENLTLGDIKKAYEQICAYFEYCGHINEVAEKEYGVLVAPAQFVCAPAENLVNELRGIKAFSIDMRRQPDKVMEYTQSLQDWIEGTIAAVVEEGDHPTQFADLYLAHNAHSVVTVKNFEKFFWEPCVKKVVDALSVSGQTGYVFWEADCIRFAELYKDVPKGTLLIQTETEDVRDIRKAFPTVAICGGMPVNMLYNSTPQECVDMAKELVDSMGEGYVFSQNKMMAFENDARRENMLAVQEFIHNYRR